jgi:hypothetical protein
MESMVDLETLLEDTEFCKHFVPQSYAVDLFLVGGNFLREASLFQPQELVCEIHLDQMPSWPLLIFAS